MTDTNARELPREGIDIIECLDGLQSHHLPV